MNINQITSTVKKQQIVSYVGSLLFSSSGGGAVSSVSGTSNQISVSPATGAVVISLPSNVIFPGIWQIGSINYSDTGILWSAQSSINSYNQVILQNTSNGAAASTNFNVSNDQGTATTNFGEFGINSSGFTGSGSFSTAGYVYLAAATTDLAIGTYGAKGIHFVVNSGASDAMTISSSQNFTFNQLAQSSSWGKAINFNLGAHTAYTATTEFMDYDFNGRTVTWIDGTTPIQRFFYLGQNTVNKTTTSAVFTDIYNFFSETSLAGSGVTFTRNWAAGFGGNIQVQGNILTKAGATTSIGVSDTQILQIVSNGFTRASIGTSGLWTFSGPSSGAGTFITFTQAGSINSSGGVASGLLWTAGAHTNQTTATEVTDINYNLSAVMKMIDGTVATQRAFRIQGRTYTPQTSALTITECSTLEVTASTAGAGTTFTNGDNWAIRCTGNLKVTGSRLNAASLPTSSAGLASGDMWKNGNVVNIV